MRPPLRPERNDFKKCGTERVKYLINSNVESGYSRRIGFFIIIIIIIKAVKNCYTDKTEVIK